MQKRSRNFNACQNRVRDLLSAHEFYQSPHMTIFNAFLDLKHEFNLPSYSWQYLHGWVDCQFSFWHRHNLVYCLVWEGKPVPMNWDKLTEEQREYLRKTPSDKANTGFFWRNKDGSIGKSYSEEKE